MGGLDPEVEPCRMVPRLDRSVPWKWSGPGRKKPADGKKSSSGRPLSNDTSPDPMRPLAPEEIEVQSLVNKHTGKQVFTGFTRMDNIDSLINYETWDKMTSSSSCPGLTV